MNSVIKRIVSISLVSALIACMGTTAFAEVSNGTSAVSQTNGWTVDENGDVIVDFEGRTTGGTVIDPEDVDEEHLISSVAEYKDFAGIETKAPKKRMMASSASLPDAVDNSTNENAIYFPPIGDQVAIGSCVAWSTTYYAYTYTANKARGIPTTAENVYSPTWSYNLSNFGHNGGSFLEAMYPRMEKIGVAKASDVTIQTSKANPVNYLSWNAEGDIWEHAAHDRISDYTLFDLDYYGTPVTGPKDSDLDVMKTAISNGDILPVTVSIFSWQHKVIKHTNTPGVDNSFVGELAAYQCDGSEGPHQMTLVGYNDNIWVDINNNDQVDSGEMGAFKIVNSWGPTYGNNGFAWIAYDALNQVSAVEGYENPEGRRALLVQPSVIRVENKDYSSNAYIKYTINTADRYDTMVIVEATDKTTGVLYTDYTNPHALPWYRNTSPNYDRSYSYNGTEGAADGTMYYDLNNLISDITPETVDNYEWEVTVRNDNATKPVTIKELKFVSPANNTDYDVLSGGQYTFTGTSRSFSCSGVTLEAPLTAGISLTPSVGNIQAPESVLISASAAGGKAPYQYRYEMKPIYGENQLLCDWTTNSSFGTLISNFGSYKFTVSVKDAEGTVSTKSINTYVNNISIYSIISDKESCVPGETVRFSPYGSIYASLIDASNFKYTITKDGVSTEYTTDRPDYSIDWTPAEAGTYTVKCEVIYNLVKYAEQTTTFNVEDAPSNTVKIYYKGYSTPNIHYQVGSGSWTAVPGMAMTPSSEVSGCTHKYTIDLGNASYANVCFNDGHGNWDSRNGANYRFERGCYKFVNGTITPIEVNTIDAALTLSAQDLMYDEVLDISCSAQGGTAPYTYKFTYTTSNGSEATLKDYSSDSATNFVPYVSGAYTIKAYVKDASGKTATASKNVSFHHPSVLALNSDKASASVGETVKFSMNVSDAHPAMTYSYSVSNGSGWTNLTLNSDKTASWTPSAAGTYTIKGVISHNNFITSKTIQYTVTAAPANTVVIYYKGYSTPNIHYQVGSGSWTTAPGFAMTPSSEVSGCTHKYTINLGSASYANVCFNDGHGNWDSRNGANYRFEKGCFKFVNGTITPVNVNTFDAALTLSAQDLMYDEVLDISCSAQGGTAPYTYKFTYTASNGSESTLKDYSSDSTVNFVPYVSGNYTIKAYVKDASGKTATASKNVSFHHPSVLALNSDKASASVGETVKFSMNVSDAHPAMTYSYSVSNGSGWTNLTLNSDKTASWTPSAAGTYTIKGVISHNNFITSKTIQYTVTAAPANTVVIYYKGYSTPNIHYQVGSGSWTNVPGVAMTPTNEVSGYTHKYTINLGSASYANVCFNDGHGNWDSRNGANYRFTKGTYKYSNGTITAM